MAPAPDSSKARDDAELLARVASADAGVAHRAQAELYARHVRYLYGAVQRHRHNLLRVAGVSAEDLVQETFHRAFERAHTFQRGDVSDDDHLRRRTRAWLGRIAQNLLADYIQRVREVSASPYLERLSCDGIDDAPSSSPELQLVCDGLGALSERERDVLRVTALYLRAGEHQRLPNAVSAELAQRWGTNSENIRAIRSRALKKLKAFIEEHGENLREVP